jgi:hypothetical protein
VTLKSAVFWAVTPRGSCRNRRFGGTYRLHRQGGIRELGETVGATLFLRSVLYFLVSATIAPSSLILFTHMTEATSPSETSVHSVIGKGGVRVRLHPGIAVVGKQMSGTGNVKVSSLCGTVETHAVWLRYDAAYPQHPTWNKFHMHRCMLGNLSYSFEMRNAGLLGANDFCQESYHRRCKSLDNAVQRDRFNWLHLAGGREPVRIGTLLPE